MIQYLWRQIIKKDTIQYFSNKIYILDDFDIINNIGNVGDVDNFDKIDQITTLTALTRLMMLKTTTISSM